MQIACHRTRRVNKSIPYDIVEERKPPKTKIKDFYSHVQDNVWKCSKCRQDVTAVTIDYLSDHLKSKHPDTFMEFKRGQVHLPANYVVPHKRIRVKDEPSNSELESSVEAPPPSDGPSGDAEYTVALDVAAHDESDRNHSRTDTSLRDNKDPLAMFFQTMYETVKEMPKDTIFDVKRKIFMTVSEAEEKLTLDRQRVNKTA